MRVAVVFFSGRKRDGMMALAKSLAKGIERQGNQVDVLEGNRDVNVRLTTYQYVAIGAENTGTFRGAVPEAVKSYLAAAGLLSGKKSYAFVLKSAFGSTRTLAMLMRYMEAEGMLLKNSDILRSAQEAEEIGKRLHIS
jgi:menaquinone-dependent protoporphyrinogen IX oxidase